MTHGAMRPARDDTLYHQELGLDGPPLVFLPGVGGTTRYRTSRVAPLAAGYGLVFIDPLAVGRSPTPCTTYGIERQIAVQHRLLVGRGPVILVGQSFGALAAVGYAARYAEQVDALGLPRWPLACCARC